MAEIRINKLMRQFNIGLGDLVSFLKKLGVEVDENPNAKVSDEYLPDIKKQFGKDLEAKQAADKVEVHIIDILNKGSKQGKQEEETEPERETVIRTNMLNNDKRSAEQKAAENKAEASAAVAEQSDSPARNESAAPEKEAEAPQETSVNETAPVEEQAASNAAEPQQEEQAAAPAETVRASSRSCADVVGGAGVGAPGGDPRCHL